MLNITLKHNMEKTVQITYESKNLKISYSLLVCKIFLTYIICAGFIYEFGKINTDNVWDFIIAMSICLIIIGLNFLSSRNKRFKALFWCAIGIIFIIEFAIYKMSVIHNGVRYILNNYIIHWNTKHKTIIGLFNAGKVDERGVLPVLILVVAVLSVVVSELIRNKKYVPLGSIILGICILNLLFDTSNFVGVALYLAGFTGLIITRSSKNFRIRYAFFTGLYLVIFLIFAIIIQSHSMNSITKMREDTGKLIDNIRYGTDSLPEGDIREGYRLNTGEEKRLEVTTEYVKPLYLKGFVGSSYVEGKWTKLTNQTYSGKNDGILEWLTGNNLDPIYQYSKYEHLNADTKLVDNYVHIRNVGAKRNYVYLPYSLESVYNAKIYSDYDYTSKAGGLFGINEYSFSEKSYNWPCELMTLGDWYDGRVADEKQLSYMQTEAVYREFVYENYLDISESIEKVINELFWENAQEEDTKSIYFVTERIRSVLEENISYNENMSEISEDKEPVTYFLTESKNGNSVLYASAAAMAFRAVGVPARYVEGYYCNNEKSKADKIILTTKDAHAWVEIYMDGMGWLPIDVTPGYYHDVYGLMDITTKPQKIEQTVSATESAKDTDVIKNTETKKNNDSENSTSKEAVEKIVLGIVMFIVMIAIVYIVVVSFGRYIRIYFIKHKYNKASEKEKSEMLVRFVFYYLNKKGIYAKLGYRPEETEKNIIEKDKAFYEGEYIRVYKIAEKVVYGEEIIEPHEQRTLMTFIEKVCISRMLK